MNLRRAKPQMFRQLELPLRVRAEGPTPRRSEAARSATHEHQRSGTSGLMEQVVETANMRSALERVRKNKGSPGIDGMTTEQLSEHLRAHWPRIREDLLADRYQPQPVRRGSIPKKGGGTRELGIPCVLDRLIQQAVLQVLQTRFDPSFSKHSHGFRPGRSQRTAVCEAGQYIAAGRQWVVDVDLEKFFDRVNHDMLMARLEHRIEDKRLLRLIRRYLNAGVMIGGVVTERYEGTPQGGPLSPLLSNVLLDEVDRALESRGHTFVRYADDCNVYVRSKRAGERVLQLLRRLYAKLRLRINEAKSTVARVETRQFLGFTATAEKSGKTGWRVADKALKAMRDRVREFTSRTCGRSLHQVIEALRSYIPGWKQYFQPGLSPHVSERLDGWIRRRLRALQVRQWQHGTRAYQALRAHGVDVRKARAGAKLLPRWWHASNSGPVSLAFPKRYFDELGLPRLVT